MKKKQTKKQKTKELKPNMVYNPGTAKYEPQLPLSKRKSKIKINWIYIILLMVALLLMLTLSIIK
jgi:hypothetical protein